MSPNYRMSTQPFTVPGGASAEPSILPEHSCNPYTLCFLRDALVVQNFPSCSFPSDISASESLPYLAWDWVCFICSA